MYSVSEAEKRRWHPLPSSKYPKPLVFHDGRIAFRPTPLAALCMFVWLPLGFPLAVVTFVLVLVVVVATTATAVVSAEERFDFLGSSIVNFLDRSDEVEVFTS